MANDLVFIFDAKKNKEIIREMTDDEQAIRDAEVSDFLAAKAAKAAETEAIKQAKIEAADKLTALGIDPKLLGL